jgi:hypothetical protein
MKAIRVYKSLDPNTIKPHLLIYGEISGQCANCGEMDVKLHDYQCPVCKTDFHYISFRSTKSHFPKIIKLLQERPSVTLIDYDDYKRSDGASKVDDFFGSLDQKY